MPRQDIGYDYEDFGMSVDDLKIKYAATNEHPEFSREVYEHAIANDPETKKEAPYYWAWVKEAIAGDDDSIEGAGEPDSATYENPPLPKNAQVVQDMDQLVLLFARWHKQANLKAQNMFEMPEGHEVEFTPSEGAEPERLVLEGDAYKGFRMGIMACVECFGPLPFTYSIEEAAEAPQEQADGPAPGQ